MADISSLLTFPRVIRHVSRIGTHLVPDQAVVLDGCDAAMRGALAAAGNGDFTAARSLLTATRLDAQWERRDDCVAEFSRYALHRPGWLDAWLEQEPEAPDAWVVKADLAIQQAWEIRTSQRARNVSAEQFKAFHTLLQDAVPVLEKAVDLNPADPVPWRIALNHAMGSQAPREVFDSYLMEVLDRDPSHFQCHAGALQYLCDKWYGSHEEMFAFAENAADRAAPDRLVNALPVLAVTEYGYHHAVGRGPVPRERVEAAVERALAFSRSRPAGDAATAGIRNHLAMALAYVGRWEEALETFAAIGVHARRWPWAMVSGGDPRETFLDTRRGVRAQLARRIPFFSRGPEPETTSAPDTSWAPKVIALCSAPLRKVEESALLTGLTLRMAPMARPAHGTFVEIAWSAGAVRRGGLRGTLLGEGDLIGAARTMTTAAEWPALILHQSDERCGFTLMRRGKQATSVVWDRVEPVADLDTVSSAAQALADAYGIGDPRPLTALLRADGPGPDRLASLCAALGLPRPPEGFGELPEVLGSLPGAKLMERRGLLAAMKESLASDEA